MISLTGLNQGWIFLEALEESAPLAFSSCERPPALLGL